MTESTDTQLGRHLASVARKRRAVRRLTVRIIGILTLIVVGSVIYLQQIGLPAPIQDHVLARINARNTYMKVSKFKLDMSIGGIRAEKPSLFQKRTLGDAFMEADAMVYELSLFKWLSGESALVGIHVLGGTFRKPNGTRAADRIYPTKIMTGRATLTDCDLEGMWVDSLSMTYTVDGPNLIIRNLSGTVGKDDRAGTIKGRLIRNDQANRIEGRLETTFDPNILIPFLDGRNVNSASTVINRFTFNNSTPEMVTDFEFTFGETPSLRLSMHLSAENCLYQSVSARSMELDMNLSLSDEMSSLNVSSLKVQRREGQLTAEFLQNFKTKSVYFNAKSTMNPKAIVAMINPDMNALFQNLRFRGRTRATANGIAYYGSPEKSDFSVHVQDSAVTFHNLQSTKCSFDLNVRGLTNAIERIHGDFYDGELAGTVKLVRDLDPKKSHYASLLTADQVDLSKLMSAITRKRRSGYDGTFRGTLNLSGLLEDENLETMAGAATLQINDSLAFKMPILGDLSGMIAKAVPGLDFLQSGSELDAVLTIKDRKVHTTDAKTRGGVLSLHAKGDYHFDNTLDYKVQVKFLKSHTIVGKGLNFFLLPVSQLLEFRLAGNTDNPHWRPVFLPKELSKLLGSTDDN